ncbi:DUF5753 domain-containing protein (plasmid) [Streptomyces goshikiensis]|uniref:DUF5753 domain-containing protein n=1 Tax=Streptomyces goshikiensis TaxID=1942 RepID=UPI00386A50A4|nr:DUF5753 domain-containing protein [Streptomyces goshikiensis]
MTDHVIRALRARDQQDMGRVAGGMGSEATDRLTSLDAFATTVRAWGSDLVPGPLQTDTYAAGAIRTMTPSLSGHQLTARVKRRAVRRAEFLERWSGPETSRCGLAWLLMSESAIVHPTLSAHGHTAQLRRLLEIIDGYPRVIVQVLRDGIPTPGVSGPFSLHCLEDGLRIGHLETLVGGWYTTRPEDVARMYSAFSDMSTRALTPRETREFIAEEISTCWAHTTDSTPGTAELPSGSPATPTPTPACTSPLPPPALSQ